MIEEQKKDSKSSIEALMIGKQVSIVRCKSCSYKSYTINDYSDISLQIPGSSVLMEAPVVAKKKIASVIPRNKTNKIVSNTTSNSIAQEEVSKSVNKSTRNIAEDEFNKACTIFSTLVLETESESVVDVNEVLLVTVDNGLTKEHGHGSSEGSKEKEMKAERKAEAGIENQLSVLCDEIEIEVDDDINTCGVTLETEMKGETVVCESNQIEPKVGEVGANIRVIEPEEKSGEISLSTASTRDEHNLKTGVRNEMTLKFCIRQYISSEILSADSGNGYKCPKCSEGSSESEHAICAEVQKRDSSKRMLFLQSAMPKILTFQLKRLLPRGKCATYIKFPLSLDMTPFLGVVVDEGTELSKRDSEVSGGDNDSNLYDLCAVVEHLGSSYGGHYVAYVNHSTTQTFSSTDMNHIDTSSSPNSDAWFYTSDSTVRKCHVDEVLKCQAYMLFYRRRNILSSETENADSESKGGGEVANEDVGYQGDSLDSKEIDDFGTMSNGSVLNHECKIVLHEVGVITPESNAIVTGDTNSTVLT